MSNTINVGDKFKPLFQIPSKEGFFVFKRDILEIVEIYPDSDSVRCLVKLLNGPDFFAEFGTYFLLKTCTPFGNQLHQDNLIETAKYIGQKCDCGAVKTYGENIGPEMHAHYCSLKSQQFIVLDKK